MNDMIQIKLAVEGMKAEIVKAFDVQEIAKSIRLATEKAVSEFDMKNYIDKTIESVLSCAGEVAINELSRKYGAVWANKISIIVDEKIAEALKAYKDYKDSL